MQVTGLREELHHHPRTENESDHGWRTRRWSRRYDRTMRWLLNRYRRWFAVVGYEYPPTYLLVANIGLVFLCTVAVAQRVAAGVSGPQWWFLIAAIGLCMVNPVASMVPCKKPHLWALPVVIIGAVTMFWMVPVHGDVAPLILDLGATMSAAVTTLRRTLVATSVYAAAGMIGAVFGPAEQGWAFVIMVGFGGAVGHLLQKQLQLLQAERREQARQSTLDRAAIAAEVHDVVAHSLSIVLLNVTAARRALLHPGEGTRSPAPTVDVADVADAVDALRDAEMTGRSAMKDVRSTIDLLRSDSGPDTPLPGLADLDELVSGFRRAGSAVSFHYRPPGDPLTSATELAVFRVVQESLSNAVRHASGAPVHVVVGPCPQSGYRVHVRNPVPAGTRRRSGGYGLAGMASRVANLNGHIQTRVQDGMWHVVADFGSVASPPGDTDGRATVCPLGGLPAVSIRGASIRGATGDG